MSPDVKFPRRAKKSSKPVVWLVEDDEYFAKKYTDGIQSFARVLQFGSPFDAHESSAASPALILIDMSAVAPIVSLAMHSVYAPIAKLGEKHPGASILIVSGVTRACLESIAEDVRGVVDNVVEIFPWGSSNSHFASVVDHVKQRVASEPCRMCGGSDDVQLVQGRIGMYRSMHWGRDEPRCAPCRKKTHRSWRWADYNKRK
jgi:hypothetical protein